MLPEVHRLRKRKDFESVFREGKGFKIDFLILKKSKNHLGQTRFGFIVGGKISKKATVRNKVKRRLRRLVQIKLPEIKTGLDIVLIAQSGLENRNLKEMEVILNKLFKKAKILK